MTLTPSQTNARDLREFVPTLHAAPYPDIDPSLVKLSQPYVACIIGGRGAVGSGLARSYARAGATGLVLCARSLPALQSVADEVKAINPTVKTLVLECDITSSSDVAAIAAATKAEFDSRLDAVVINAGYSGKMQADITLETPGEFQTAFSVQAVGTYHAAHYLIPLLKATPNGAMAFIAINSMAAPTIAGPVAHIHYCASKMAQVRILEMMAEQDACRGVFCASVHPGGVVSEFSERSMPREYQHLLVDDPNLAGSFCVWLTKDKAKADALNGRFLSCKWDVTELLAKLDEIKTKDLLKFRVAI